MSFVGTNAVMIIVAAVVLVTARASGLVIVKHRIIDNSSTRYWQEYDHGTCFKGACSQERHSVCPEARQC